MAAYTTTRDPREMGLHQFFNLFCPFSNPFEVRFGTRRADFGRRDFVMTEVTAKSKSFFMIRQGDAAMNTLDGLSTRPTHPKVFPAPTV
jgi:hypothetical protein